MMTRYFIIAVILLIFFKLGMQTNTLATASLAIVIVFYDLLANLCAGALVHLFRLFRVGDFVKYAGDYGIIEKIQFFNTQLRTADNKILTCTNARLLRENIISWS